jgi:PAS domain S-box-containing protein
MMKPEGTPTNSSTSLVLAPRQLRRVTWLCFALWTLAMAASVAWNTHLLRDAMWEAATTDARSDFDKDVVYRRWATLHGGVYVPVTARTSPNPYLTNVVERDLVTPSGRRLTLMNPDDITRRVHELEVQESDRQGHLTSLKPLRPENAPDSWEAAALRAFGQGRAEVSSRETLNGQPYLRLMKPLVTEAGCLQCHTADGHQEGGIRGGISAAVPLEPYLALARLRTTHIALAHAGLWALGALGIFLTAHQMRQHLDKQMQAEEKLQQLSWAVEQSPASIVITNLAGDIEYANPKLVAVTGYTLAEVLGKNPRVLKSGEKSPEAYRELWQTITAGKEWRGEFHNKKKNGELYWESASISPIRDLAGRITHYVAVKEEITARKQIEAERDQLIQDLQKAVANVKSLSGLLPICAGCKKIRDDKGYWSQVESYVQEHSEATFTHALCPDCIRKYYPELGEAAPAVPARGLHD